jgi:hypothetical protein
MRELARIPAAHPTLMKLAHLGLHKNTSITGVAFINYLGVTCESPCVCLFLRLSYVRAAAAMGHRDN